MKTGLSSLSIAELNEIARLATFTAELRAACEADIAEALGSPAPYEFQPWDDTEAEANPEPETFDFDSSWIACGEWEQPGLLTLTFHNGTVATEIPMTASEWADFKNADSPGQYWHANLKGRVSH